LNPRCVVFFYSLSQIEPHSAYAVGNEITTRMVFKQPLRQTKLQTSNQTLHLIFEFKLGISYAI
jgi:hypothetical protein